MASRRRTAARLRDLRTAAGLTQKEVARFMPAYDGSGSLSDVALSFVENGKLRIPWGFSRDYRAAVELAVAERGRG